MDEPVFHTAHLVGNSLGGWVAIRARRARPGAPPWSRWRLLAAGRRATSRSGKLLALPEAAPADRQGHRAARRAEAIPVHTRKGAGAPPSTSTTSYEHGAPSRSSTRCSGVAACPSSAGAARARAGGGLVAAAPSGFSSVRSASWGQAPTGCCPGPPPPHASATSWVSHGDWVELDGVGHCPSWTPPRRPTWSRPGAGYAEDMTRTTRRKAGRGAARRAPPATGSSRGSAPTAPGRSSRSRSHSVPHGAYTGDDRRHAAAVSAGRPTHGEPATRAGRPGSVPEAARKRLLGRRRPRGAREQAAADVVPGGHSRAASEARPRQARHALLVPRAWVVRLRRPRRGGDRLRVGAVAQLNPDRNLDDLPGAVGALPRDEPVAGGAGLEAPRPCCAPRRPCHVLSVPRSRSGSGRPSRPGRPTGGSARRRPARPSRRGDSPTVAEACGGGRPGQQPVGAAPADADRTLDPLGVPATSPPPARARAAPPLDGQAATPSIWWTSSSVRDVLVARRQVLGGAPVPGRGEQDRPRRAARCP